MTMMDDDIANDNADDDDFSEVFHPVSPSLDLPLHPDKTKED